MNANALDASQVQPNLQLGLSSYDRVSAALVAALFLLCFFTLVLFGLWLDTFERGQTFVVDPNPTLTNGELDVPVDSTLEVMAVDSAELPELEASGLVESLQAVVQASSEASSIQAWIQHGKGPGYGVSKLPGTGVKPIGASKPRMHWEVNLTTVDLDSYSRMLRTLGIHVCAVHEVENEVLRLVDPGSTEEKFAHSDKESERGKGTLLFAHRLPELKEWDLKLLRRAGLNTRKYVVGQIYPDKLIETLRDLELKHCEEAGRKLEDIRSTTFGLIESGDDFEFQIVSQVYLNGNFDF